MIDTIIYAFIIIALIAYCFVSDIRHTREKRYLIEIIENRPHSVNTKSRKNISAAEQKLKKWRGDNTI